jgi:predicted component of type VI protein secretion system
MTNNQVVEQAVIVTQASIKSGQTVTQIALFESDGSPVSTLLAEVPDGGDILLTGFTTGSAAALAATDTVNEAFAKLQARTLAAPAIGSNVLLTGYSIGTGKVAIAATDSVNAAIAKIESRLVLLEGA